MSVRNLTMIDVIRAGAESSCTPCLLLPLRTLPEAWADRAAKALETARANPAPSCRWSGSHLTSRYGNFCSMCGTEMPKPHFYPSAKTAEVIEFPLTEADVNFAGSRL